MTRSRSIPAVIACALTAVLMTLGLSLGATPALAHAGLTSSNPENGAVLDALPGEVVLEFTEEIGAPAFVVVTDSDGHTLQTGDPVIDGATVRQSIDAATHAGRHTIAYRVVSTDGHPIQGHVRVTVDPGADAGLATETASTGITGADSAADDASADSDSGMGSTPLIVAGVVVLLLALLLGVLALTKRGRQ
ncbi:copper resistance CopC family protein [Nocardioides gilvus]|uniref:copper resistance CopC family protein n=1 Tax=Nocardioides gilvus TaxID=1735589 RepID=UPI000D745DA6|nr:copper resistance CopC family protein [Nocardioides gilvus]